MRDRSENKKPYRRTARLAATLTSLLMLAAAGCKSKNTAAPAVGPDGQDPATANMAAPYTGGSTGGYNGNTGTTRVLSSSQSFAGQASGQDYSDAYGQQAAAPIIRQAPPTGEPLPPQGVSQQDGYSQADEAQGYNDAQEAGEQALEEADQAPPPLPQYDQPAAPDPNYLWTPGYWDYASAGYYWVPGAWVAPPFYGALWTPAWWGYSGGHYRFHRGYWGPHVGFYGGINYGFGFIGTGYYGGYWRGHDFFYNRAVTNVNLSTVHNVYERAVVYDNHTFGPRPSNRVDFNGGPGGINARPNGSEVAALHEAHYSPVAAQRDARLEAASNRGQFFRNDGGHPAAAFAARPLGTREGIASVPRQQPFNHVTAFAGVRQPGGPAATHGSPNGAQPGNPAGAVMAHHDGAPALHGEGSETRGSNPGETGRRIGPGGAMRPGTVGEAGRPVPVGGMHEGVRPGQPGNGFEGRTEPNRTGQPSVPASGRPEHEIRGAERQPFLQTAPGQGQPRGERGPGQNQPFLRTAPAGAEGRSHIGRPEGGTREMPVERQGAPAARPEAAPAPHAAPTMREAPAMQHGAPQMHAAPTGTAPRGGGGEHGGHH